MLAEAKREGDRILGEAREQAVREASQTEIVKLAERQAQDIIDDARRQAREHAARDGGLGRPHPLDARGEPRQVPDAVKRGRERLHERSQETVVAGVGPGDRSEPAEGAVWRGHGEQRRGGAVHPGVLDRRRLPLRGHDPLPAPSAPPSPGGGAQRAVPIELEPLDARRASATCRSREGRRRGDRSPRRPTGHGRSSSPSRSRLHGPCIPLLADAVVGRAVALAGTRRTSRAARTSCGHGRTSSRTAARPLGLGAGRVVLALPDKILRARLRRPVPRLRQGPERRARTCDDERARSALGRRWHELTRRLSSLSAALSAPVPCGLDLAATSRSAPQLPPSLRSFGDSACPARRLVSTQISLVERHRVAGAHTRSLPCRSPSARAAGSQRRRPQRRRASRRCCGCSPGSTGRPRDVAADRRDRRLPAAGARPRARREACGLPRAAHRRRGGRGGTTRSPRWRSAGTPGPPPRYADAFEPLARASAAPTWSRARDGPARPRPRSGAARTCETAALSGGQAARRLAASCSRASTSSCSTSRRTTSTSTASRGSSGSSRAPRRRRRRLARPGVPRPDGHAGARARVDAAGEAEYPGGWSEYEAARDRRARRQEYARWESRSRSAAARAARPGRASGGGARYGRRAAVARRRSRRDAKSLCELARVGRRRSRTSRGSSRSRWPRRSRSGRLVARLESRDRERRSSGSARSISSWTGARGGLDAGQTGRGKTTTARAARKLPLAAGTRYVGPGAVLGELDQERARFAGPESLLDAFCRAADVPSDEARTLLAKYGLGADDVLRPAAVALAGRAHACSRRPPCRTRRQLPPPRRAHEPPRPPRRSRSSKPRWAGYDGTLLVGRDRRLTLPWQASVATARLDARRRSRGPLAWQTPRLLEISGIQL